MAVEKNQMVCVLKQKGKVFLELLLTFTNSFNEKKKKEVKEEELDVPGKEIRKGEMT